MKGPSVKLLASFVGSALVAGAAQAEIVVYEKDGYRFSTDGWIILNASSTRGDADANDAFRITSGDSPNLVGFNFAVPETNGIRMSSRLGLRINPHSGEGNFKNRGNVGDSASKSIDPREIYAKFEGDFGQVLIGKHYSIFNGRPVLWDASVLAGGFFGYDNANSGFALAAGSLHSGYLYANFNSGLVYRTPQDKALKAAVGLYDPSQMGNVFIAGAPTASKTTTPRVEAELAYDGRFEGGAYTLYVDGVYQSAENCRLPGGAVCAGGDRVTGKGASTGVQLALGPVALSATAFTGRGLGSALMFDFDALDAQGRERKSRGYWVQVTGKVTPSTMLRLSYGRTEVDDTAATPGHTAEGTLAGVYHTVNPFMTLYGELGRSEFDLNPAFGRATDTRYATLGVRFMW